MNNFFFSLTPDIVIKALEEGGFSPTGHCMALNSYENRVYDLKLDDGTHVVSKFYRPGRWTREQIQEEHDFLFELQGDEIQVCAPIRFPDGETLHKIEDIYYAIWPRTGGRIPDELSDEMIERLGRLLARIHNMGASKKTMHRIALTGPAVQDVWMLVSARDREDLRQRKLFIGACRLFRDFDPMWLRLVEPLRSLRYIRYAAWIARRWEYPAFPAAFPHFGAVQYWENETADLGDQLNYIYSNSNDLPEGLRKPGTDDNNEEELTNKDFFWDWEDKKINS